MIRAEVNTMSAERQPTQPEISHVSWRPTGSLSRLSHSTRLGNKSVESFRLRRNSSPNPCQDGSSREKFPSINLKTQRKLGNSSDSLQMSTFNNDQPSVTLSEDSLTCESSAYVLSSLKEPWTGKMTPRNTSQELQHGPDNLKSITPNEVPRYMRSWTPQYSNNTKCFIGNHSTRMNKPEGPSRSKSPDEKVDLSVFDLDTPTRKRSETCSGLSDFDQLTLSEKLSWSRRHSINGDLQHSTKSNSHGEDLVLNSDSVTSNSDAHNSESFQHVAFEAIENNLNTFRISHHPSRSVLCRDSTIVEDLIAEKRKDKSHSLRLDGRSAHIDDIAADDGSNSTKNPLGVSSKCTMHMASLKDAPETPNLSESPSSDRWAHLYSPILGRARVGLIEEAMNEFQQLFTSSSLMTSCNPNSAASGSQTGSTSFPSQQTGFNSTGRGQARNNGAQGRNPPDDGNDGNPNKRPRKDSVTTDRNIGSTPRYACPYFKRDPLNYGGRGACSGPGWESVHRLKEHLYRSHARLVHCPRCNLDLASDQDLIDHLSSKYRCEESTDFSNQKDQSLERFDKDQEIKLRKRSSSRQTENEKWMEVYRILFPDDDHSRMPSPFYEHKLGIPSERQSSPTSDAITRFEDLCKRELPGIMRSKLELIIDEELQSISERIKSRVPEIVRSSQEEFLQRFQHLEPASSNNAQGFRESERRHLNDTVGRLSPDLDLDFGSRDHISKFYSQAPLIADDQNIRHLEESIRDIAQEKGSTWNLGSDSGYRSGVSNNELVAKPIDQLDALQGLNNLGGLRNIGNQLDQTENTPFGVTNVMSSANNPSSTQEAGMLSYFGVTHWSDEADLSYFGPSRGAYL